MGTGTEILSVTPPTAPSRPWEVGKYRNQISGVKTAEAVVGKCSGLAWPPPLSWESNPLALLNPSPVGPKAILAPQEPLLPWVTSPGTWSLWVWWGFCIMDLLSLGESWGSRKPSSADTPSPRMLPLWAAFLRPLSPAGPPSLPLAMMMYALTCETGIYHQDSRVISGRHGFNQG